MTTTFFLRSKSGDDQGVIHFLFSTGYGKIKSTTGLKINKKDWSAGFPKKTVATTEIRSLLTSFMKLVSNDRISVVATVFLGKPADQSFLLIFNPVVLLIFP